MKKKLCMMALTLALAAGCALPVSAITPSSEIMASNGTKIQTNTTYFEDGSYIVNTIEDMTPVSRSTVQKIIKATSVSYDSSKKARCALSVIGSFEVNPGVSVKCVGAKSEKVSYQSGWSVENVTTYPDNSSTSKASAIASGRFVERVGGIAVQSIPVTVRASCDKNGNPA